MVNFKISRGVSKVIRGVHEKIRFRQAVFQKPETSIFFRDVSRVIRGVHEKSLVSAGNLPGDRSFNIF